MCCCFQIIGGRNIYGIRSYTKYKYSYIYTYRVTFTYNTLQHATCLCSAKTDRATRNRTVSIFIHSSEPRNHRSQPRRRLGFHHALKGAGRLLLAAVPDAYLDSVAQPPDRSRKLHVSHDDCHLGRAAQPGGSAWDNVCNTERGRVEYLHLVVCRHLAKGEYIV